MKTLKPSFVTDRNKSILSLLDINIGSILIETNPVSMLSTKFIVVGISISDYIMASVFEMAKPSHNSYMIPIKNDTILPYNETTKCYVDCSRVIVRRFGSISAWLKKHPNGICGQLNETDLNNTIEAVRNAPTISKNIKQDFCLMM